MTKIAHWNAVCGRERVRGSKRERERETCAPVAGSSFRIQPIVRKNSPSDICRTHDLCPSICGTHKFVPQPNQQMCDLCCNWPAPNPSVWASQASRAMNLFGARMSRITNKKYTDFQNVISNSQNNCAISWENIVNDGNSMELMYIHMYNMEYK